MKQKSSSRKSKTNFRRLRSAADDGIVRRGLKVVLPKASVSLRIDADVLEWFKSTGAGYQTRMNAVLRAFKEASG